MEVSLDLDHDGSPADYSNSILQYHKYLVCTVRYIVWIPSSPANPAIGCETPMERLSLLQVFKPFKPTWQFALLPAMHTPDFWPGQDKEFVFEVFLSRFKHEHLLS